MSPIDENQPIIEPLKLVFAPEDGRDASEPARLDLIDQQVYEGVSISPAIEGSWRWDDGRTLLFDPEKDWPANTEYNVQFGPAAFAEDAQLAQYSVTFTTAPFTATLESIDFHQDPDRREDRRVFATLEFSHAPKREGLEQAISLGMRPSGATKGVALNAQQFEFSQGTHARVLHIKSEPISLPAQANVMKLALSRDTRSQQANARLASQVSCYVRIPD